MLPKTRIESPATSNGAGSFGVEPHTEFKEKCRRIVAQGLHHTGLLRAVERLARSHGLRSVAGSSLPRLHRTPGPKFGILCYHRVGTEGVPLFSRLEPKAFEAQMRYVKKHYRVVPLGQLCRELQDGAEVEPTLAVTFDDGYRDLYIHALPVLQKFGIPATIYLIGRCMETGEVPWYDKIFLALKAFPGGSLDVELDGPQEFRVCSLSARAAAAWKIVRYLRNMPDTYRRKWCDVFERQIPLPEKELEGRMLNWDQVRTMHRYGVSFGSHTMSHPVVSRLDPQALKEELMTSKQLLESGLGVAVEDFAYPFGKPEDCCSAAEEFLIEHGYRSAVTTACGFNTPGTSRFRLRRLQIGEDSSLAEFAFSVSRLFFEDSSDQTLSVTEHSANRELETQRLES